MNEEKGYKLIFSTLYLYNAWRRMVVWCRQLLQQLNPECCDGLSRSPSVA